MPTNYDDLIDGYLRGRLDREAEREVQRLIVEDDAFKEALDLRKRTKDAFLQLEHQRLKHRLQRLAKPEEQKPIRTFRKTRSGWWLAAAALVLLPAIAFLFWPKSLKHTSDELFAHYYTPYPNIAQPLVRDVGRTDRRTEAYAYYEQGAYDRAYKLFGELEQAGSDDPMLSFYRGIAAMELGHFEEAISAFAAYQEVSDARLSRQTQWYLALAYVKLDDRSSAAQLLKGLAAAPGYKQTEAEALLANY